ncbi:MAG: hypothetical protein ABI671_04105 [Burkholderiales bacterium]
MKDFLIPPRFRNTASARPALARPVPDAPRPFRLWMTGSLAVVMAAMIPLRDVSDTERSNVMRVLRHSRFGVNETVLRIENSARQHGLSVLVRMAGSRPVIVLASSVGGTLVVMDGATSALDVPLSVMVRAGAAGGADVLVASSKARLGTDGWSELPPAVADDLAALPGLVDRALG